MENRGDGIPESDRNLVEKFVQNQSKDIALRAQELEIQKQKDNNQLSFAQESLGAQERDRVHERECARAKHRDRLYFFAFLAVLLAAILGLAIGFGRPKLAMELVKAILLAGAGAAGGYGYATVRAERRGAAEQLDAED